ncbi:uncharacterized protein LOC113554887 [Rhopalosiphum maidis]|uniref:uncharacterized protein LOC113554887 n=1 Tax=Rhopalosiphum maidis TaxID=43146 RepID=UPI000EFF1964|nr:uncharacterized protein LOC113554887 [Rhopalosiphum maidis]
MARDYVLCGVRMVAGLRGHHTCPIRATSSYPGTRHTMYTFYSTQSLTTSNTLNTVYTTQTQTISRANLSMPKSRKSKNITTVTTHHTTPQLPYIVLPIPLLLLTQLTLPRLTDESRTTHINYQNVHP